MPVLGSFSTTASSIALTRGFIGPGKPTKNRRRKDGKKRRRLDKRRKKEGNGKEAQKKPPEVDCEALRRRRGTRRSTDERNHQLKAMRSQNRGVKLHQGILARLREKLNQAKDKDEDEQARRGTQGGDHRQEPQHAELRSGRTSTREETPCGNVVQGQCPPADKITRREFTRMLKDKADEQGEQAAKRWKLRDGRMHEHAREKSQNSSGTILYDIRGAWGESLNGKVYRGRIHKEELSAIDNLLKAGRQPGGS